MAVSFCSRASGQKRDASFKVLYRDNMHVCKRTWKFAASFFVHRVASIVFGAARGSVPVHRIIDLWVRGHVVCTDNDLLYLRYYMDMHAYAYITTGGCICL